MKEVKHKIRNDVVSHANSFICGHVRPSKKARSQVYLTVHHPVSRQVWSNVFNHVLIQLNMQTRIIFE
jgi:DNA-binding cell septation regulator SpoVG